MMTVTTLGSLNTESFCDHVLSCVKLGVSDLHVCLKTDEIRMLVILRMNHEFMKYISSSLEMRKKMTRSERLISSRGLTFDRIQ